MPQRHIYSVTQHLRLEDDPMGRWSYLAFAYNPDYTAEVARPLVNGQGNEVAVAYHKAQLEMSNGEAHSLHMQGILELKTRVAPRVVAAWYSGDDEADNGCCVEFAKSPQALDEYCEKEDETKIQGPWRLGVLRGYGEGQGKRNDLQALADEIINSGLFAASKIHAGTYLRCASAARDFANMHGPKPKLLGVPTQLRPWQKTVFDMVNEEADDRTIIWVHDSKGGMGKTKLSKYLKQELDAMVLEVAKKDDLAYIIAGQVDAGNPCNVIIFDVPRSKMECMGGLYALAEKLKDGSFISSKYQSREVVLPKIPHLLFFSNSMPEEGKWSTDRLKLINLDTYEEDQGAQVAMLFM